MEIRSAKVAARRYSCLEWTSAGPSQRAELHCLIGEIYAFVAVILTIEVVGSVSLRAAIAAMEM